MDELEKKKYMAYYNSRYKRGHSTSYLEDKYLINKHSDSPLLIEPTTMNFKGSDFDEPRFCSVFGCGVKLSLEELRFGNRCVNHPKNK